MQRRISELVGVLANGRGRGSTACLRQRLRDSGYGFVRVRIVLGLLLLCLPIACLAEVLRVMSLNAEWFPGRVPHPAPAEQARHIVALQAMLYEVNPDLWLVQEVQRAEALPLAMAVLPDFRLYIASAFETGLHDLAIAGRLPLRAARACKWRTGDPETEPPRGVAFCAVELPDGRYLLVFTLHMKSNFTGYEDYDPVRNVAMREAEAQLFVDYVRDIRETFADATVAGLLLGGDLNVLYPRSLLRGERTVQILEANGFDYLGGNGVDHFFGMGLDQTGFRVLVEYNVSDHRAILLEIPLPEGPAVERAARRDPSLVAARAGEIRTNVNTAGADELRSLPGIGPVLAMRIIANRPFASVQELVDVCGIGPVTLSIMGPFMKVSPPAAEDAMASPVTAGDR